MLEIKAQIYDLLLERNKLIQHVQSIEAKIQELERQLEVKKNESTK